MMFFDISLYIALTIFTIGLLYKVSTWFRCSLLPTTAEISPGKRVAAAAKGIVLTVFSLKILTLLKVLVLEILLQVRTLKESRLRWWMHTLIYGGFMLLLLMHALEKTVSKTLFSHYYSTLNPFIFLRDFFGLMVLAGLGLAIYRRLFMKIPRLKTSPMDHYAVIILAVIMVSGFLLEGAKITSYTRYQEMVEVYADAGSEEELKALESLWIKEYGMVSTGLKGPFEENVLEKGRELNESCIACHSRPQWAFMGYGVAKAIAPAATALDKAGLPTFLWYIHFLACFIGLAYLPFSKMFHIIVGPLSLMANAVMDPETSDPHNITTRQIMELDACTHCGSCTTRCSVGIVFEEIPNVNILPSEKIAAIKNLASGRNISRQDIRSIQEGLYLCTNCLRCTGVCPVGINLQHLWLSAREALLQKGCPELMILSPLSLYRGLMQSAIGPQRYQQPIDAAKKLISDEYQTDIQDNTINTSHRDDTLKHRLRLSHQSSTFSFCYNCKTCTSACPVVHNYERPRDALGLVPHQIMHATALGLGDLIFSSKMLWACLGCYRCQDQCPQGVHVTDVFYELKNIAIKKIKDQTTDL
ncbi:MAG: 4Fe-4S dicluster domain-containing protein [Thermodesulfobacteriota bacterium]